MQKKIIGFLSFIVTIVAIATVDFNGNVLKQGDQQTNRELIINNVAEAEWTVVLCLRTRFSRCHIDQIPFSPYRGVAVPTEILQEN